MLLSVLFIGYTCHQDNQRQANVYFLEVLRVILCMMLI